MEKIHTDLNYELEKFRLNFPAWANRGIAPSERCLYIP